MSVSLRESIRGVLPYFLAEGEEEAPNVGWKIMWSIALQADAMIDWVIEGSRAALPGVGTPTALPIIARARAVVRGRVETETSFVERLVSWRELHRARGKMFGVAREVQHYLGPTAAGGWWEVRVVNRGGTWGILDTTRTWSWIDPPAAAWSWDWDSVSHPERSACHADMWVIVCPPPGSTVESAPPFQHVPAWGVSTTSWGHEAPQAEVGTLRNLVDAWKAARTRVLAVIWAPAVHMGSPVLDPREAGSIRPNGQWGSWGTGNSRVASRPSWLRFWE